MGIGLNDWIMEFTGGDFLAVAPKPTEFVCEGRQAFLKWLLLQGNFYHHPKSPICDPNFLRKPVLLCLKHRCVTPGEMAPLGM